MNSNISELIDSDDYFWILWTLQKLLWNILCLAFCHYISGKARGEAPLHQFSIPPSAIDSESIKPLSVLHSGLKREW